jgi:hypothetical protein
MRCRKTSEKLEESSNQVGYEATIIKLTNNMQNIGDAKLKER